MDWSGDLMLIIFVVLFIVQTIIYLILLLRVRKKFLTRMLGVVLNSNISYKYPSRGVVRTLEELSSSNGLRARDLSERLGLSREYVARLLKRLVEDGLVVRSGKPYKYRITELGRGLLKEIRRGGRPRIDEG